MVKLFLGVDGGGTKCRIRLADADLNTLGETVMGRSNLQLENGEPAYRSVIDGTNEVFRQAGIDIAEAKNTYACLGMAGGRLPSARDALLARPWPFGDIAVFDDIDIARAGAHSGRDGAVMIIGTGSAGLALIDGERHQVGGWGFHMGDGMSGAILGRQLLRRSVEATDGLSEGSPLTKAVIEKLGGGDMFKVMDWSFRAKPADFGSLVPLFFEYLDEGDPVAKQLLEFEFAHVDEYVAWFKKRGAEKIAVVGGFGERLFPLLTGRYGDVIVRAEAEPLHGALILARQLFGA